MKVPSVPLQIWSSLCENVTHFKELLPGESLHDSDVFGVLDPGTGPAPGVWADSGWLRRTLTKCRCLRLNPPDNQGVTL